MRPYTFYVDDLEMASGSAFRHFLNQQRRDQKRWASGGKFRPDHKPGWEDDDYNNYDEFDDYSDYDDYNAEEFDSYGTAGSLSG